MSRLVVLAGGVGGAKLALGCQALCMGDDLTVVGNVGDDFHHCGLRICPDLDTLMYTLAGVVNTETGWGRADETWTCLQTLADLGGEDWFQLGDRDLAVHLLRTAELAKGRTLTEVTGSLCAALDLPTRVLPVTDASVATRVISDQGELAFQEYFVRERAEPIVKSIRFAGADESALSPEVAGLLASATTEAILIAPSNPWLSIDPMLAVGGMREALRNAPAPVVAISPIVNGQAIKGPTAKIMRELSLDVSPLSVARHYRDVLDGFILDSLDQQLAADVSAEGLAVLACQTIMNTLADKKTLAQAARAFAADLRVHAKGK